MPDTFGIPGVPTAVTVIDTAPTPVRVANTTAETPFYSKLIPPNLLGTSSRLHLIMQTTMRNDGGVSATLTIRLRYNGIALATGTWATTTTGTAPFTTVDFGYIMEAIVSAQGYPAQQIGTLAVTGPLVEDSGALDALIAGAFQATTTASGITFQTGQQNLLQMTAQWGGAGAALIFIMQHAKLLYLP